MSLFKKFGKYKAFAKCPNCGAGTELGIPKGIAVADYVKGGKCICGNCGVTFYPEEYTTEHFEKEKKRILAVVSEKYKPPKPKANPDYELMKKRIDRDLIDVKKLKDKEEDFKEGIKWWS